MTESTGKDGAVSFHATRSWCRSASPSMGSAPTGAPGSATAASSSAVKCAARRSTVEASNRSVANSKEPVRLPWWSVRRSVRSNFEVSMAALTGDESRPGSENVPEEAFCSENITWNSGERLWSRSGARSCTRRSKGISWWA